MFASALLIGGGLNRAEQMASMHETAAATQQAPQTEAAPARDADAPAERDERSGQDQAVAPAGAAGSADGGESSNKLTPGVAGVPSGPLSQDPSVEQPAPNLAPTLVPQLRSLVEAHYQKLSGYLERVRAMIESFERDWANPSLDVRKRHRSMAERLDYDLLQDYLDCRDAGGKLEMEFPQLQETVYPQKRGEVLKMYLLLDSVVSAYANDAPWHPGDGGWDLSCVLYAEAPWEHRNEIWEPIEAAMVNGQNKSLAEFLQIYNGFTLE